MTSDDIRRQSENAYNQWCVQWREQAKIHSKYEMHSMDELEFAGVGKAVVVVANGFSLEENIETLKKYQDNVDIMVCDKALGTLLDHGIKPTYCMACDANVSYEKYMEPWEDQLSDIIFFSNVCGAPSWTEGGKWKKMYFFANEDILGSEKEFIEISGCPNVIPAATNVSNAMVVLLTRSENENPRNFFGYDKLLLLGYDYCWKADGKYYAFDQDGGGKTNYMRHVHCLTISRDYAYTSSNLLFSARWFERYIAQFRLPVVQCTESTITSLSLNGKLEEQIQYRYKTEDGDTVKSLVSERKKLQESLDKLNSDLVDIGRDHFYEFKKSV